METTSYAERRALSDLAPATGRLARPAAARCTNGSVSRPPREEQQYSWLEDHLSRLEGKEARSEYYARL